MMVPVSLVLDSTSLLLVVSYTFETWKPWQDFSETALAALQMQVTGWSSMLPGFPGNSHALDFAGLDSALAI